MEMKLNFDTEDIVRILTQATGGAHLLLELDGCRYKLYHKDTEIGNGTVVFESPELEEELQEKEKEKEEEKHTPQKYISKKDIKFHSYDGKYPHLCIGTLKLQIGDEIREYDDLIISRGYVTPEGEVVRMPWEIHEEVLEKDIRGWAKYIRDLVNKNIDWGCCGGCI